MTHDMTRCNLQTGGLVLYWNAKINTENSEIYLTFWYFMDRVSFCNVSVIQQDTQYLMINFIHNIQ
jgi:hypothetical protein